MPENKFITEHLEVIFTEDQIKQKGQELAKTMQEADQLITEKKQVVADYNERINQKHGAVNELKDHVNNGRANLPVKCEVRYNDPDPGVKSIVRLDTNEVISSFEMTGQERQVRMDDFVDIEQADAPETNKEPFVKMPFDDTEVRDTLANVRSLTGNAKSRAEFEKVTNGSLSITNPEEIEIILQDETGTLFRFKDSESVYFDESVKSLPVVRGPEDWTVEELDVKLKSLDDAMKAEPESPGFDAWSNEYQELKKLRSKRVRKDRDAKKKKDAEPVVSSVNETPVITIPEQEETPPVTLDKEVKTKTPARKIDDVFAKRTAEWFIERIGNEVEAKNTDPNQFSGAMMIDDQEHAEYLAAVSQNELGFTYRDVQGS